MAVCWSLPSSISIRFVSGRPARRRRHGSTALSAFLRRHRLGTADYGSSDDQADFRNQIKWSPLHNIKGGVRYPALLVTTSDHDDRVVPAHSFKYIATIQAKDTGPAPHLIRIGTNSGHGASSLSKRIDEAADSMAFSWFNMGYTPHFPQRINGLLHSGTSRGPAGRSGTASITTSASTGQVMLKPSAMP